LVKITFDPAKRATTLEERGLDFADRTRDPIRGSAPGLWRAPISDDRLRERTNVIVVWTPRGDARHIIPMRKYNAREQTKYGQRLGEG
jgi:uncharacterized DUF497 family protein